RRKLVLASRQYGLGQGSILPESDMAIKSVQILRNSAEGMETVAPYSVSGMPRCSWSMSMSLRSYSLMRSLSLLSKTRLSTSGASSALRVGRSSFWAARRTLVREMRLTPRAMFLSQRQGEKASVLSIMDTRATWLLSMAWRAMPESLQSKLQSWTRSLMAPTTFFRTAACSSRASSIAGVAESQYGAG